jgi:hypothetical protein
MATNILGLFTSPEQYQANQMAQFRQQSANEVQLDPFQQAAMGMRQAGYQLGGGIGGALGGQDPQLQIIARRQALAGQLDPSNPNSYMQTAKMAADAGDQEFAIAIADAGRKAMSEIAKAREADLKPVVVDGRVVNSRTGQVMYESPPKPEKEEFVVVGNALVSKTTQKPVYQGEKPEKISAFAQELIDAGLTPGTEPFQQRMIEYVTGKVKGAAKGTGNVIIGGISVDTGAAGKAAGKIIGENVANVENQYSLLTSVGDAVKLIDKGIYAGAYGPEKGLVAKFTGIGDPKKVQNTEVFMANIGEIVIPRLQQFGGNDSNEELKYLQKVVAGDQRIEPESMKRILASAEKKIRNNISRLQKQAETGKTGNELPLQPMNAPTPSAPKATKRYNPQTKRVESITGE